MRTPFGMSKPSGTTGRGVGPDWQAASITIATQQEPATTSSLKRATRRVRGTITGRFWPTVGSAARQSAAQPGGHLAECHPLLRHRVALADGDGLVVEGLEVHRDAEWGTDLVLPTVALADCGSVVEVDVPVAAELGGEVARSRRQLFVAGQRQHGHFDRCQARIESQDRALVDAALGVRGLVLGVGIDE